MNPDTGEIYAGEPREKDHIALSPAEHRVLKTLPREERMRRLGELRAKGIRAKRTKKRLTAKAARKRNR